MIEPNIYILCPDYSVPVGGVKMLYRHVDILNNHGFSAFIVHNQNNFRCTWFDNNTRVAYGRDIQLQQSDYLVIPEIYGSDISRIEKGIRKVIFNQNSYLTFKDYSLKKENLMTPFLDRDTVAVIVVSEDNKNYLNYVFPDLNFLRIHYSINPILFSYQSNKKKQICFMPRKNFTDALQVINILKFRNALGDFEIVPIHDKSEKEVAEILRESLIFLSFGYPEGCPLPPAEAMACGCLVIGYHGGGGKEYFRSDFSFPIEVGDIIGFANTVERVINDYEENPELISKKAEIAATFIKNNYAPAIETRDIIECWNKIIKIPFTGSSRLPSSCQQNEKINITSSLKGGEINLILFPDWCQPEEALYLELEQVFREILTHSDKNSLALFIDTDNIPNDSEFDANLVLSGVVMKLLMQEDLEIPEEPKISLVGKLSKIEWQALLPHLHFRIRLNNENQHAIAEVGAENIPVLELDNLRERQNFA
jgi:glycosyltransferase involved in cell wall biosynthesis